MSEPARGARVTIENLTKSYGRVAVVRQVSIDVAPGEFCTILGESGSGKTTLLKVIAGFESFETGRLLRDGKDMGGVAIERRNIGMVFQHYSLFPHMTVRMNVGFGLEMRRRPRSEISRKVAEVLALVDLTGYGERMPSELSGGQQQRVALARSLVIDPSILLMDEPLGALDPALRRSIQLQLKTLHRALGLTIIYVTHDQAEALHLSDRIVIMNEGRIVQEGTPQDVYMKPRNAFVARFLGECNIFRDERGNEYAVRPEDVTIAKSAPGEVVDGHSTAVVEAVMFLGNGHKVIARSGEQEVMAYVANPLRVREYRPGDTIRYSFDAASAQRLESGPSHTRS